MVMSDAWHYLLPLFKKCVKWLYLGNICLWKENLLMKIVLVLLPIAESWGQLDIHSSLLKRWHWQTYECPYNQLCDQVAVYIHYFHFTYHYHPWVYFGNVVPSTGSLSYCWCNKTRHCIIERWWQEILYHVYNVM